ncbi:hypothetical protein QFZ72_003106 [Bacillus sp. V2I10]|nr:hypothetical protein [Bacillus sp. V2I10]
MELSMKKERFIGVEGAPYVLEKANEIVYLFHFLFFLRFPFFSTINDSSQRSLILINELC